MASKGHTMRWKRPHLYGSVRREHGLSIRHTHCAMVVAVYVVCSCECGWQRKYACLFTVGLTQCNVWFFFLSYDIKLGLARSNLALRDRIWPCEIKFGLARSNMALQDQIWPCEIKYSLARSNTALRDRIWPCEIKFVLARSHIALPDQIWPCEIKYGLANRIWPCEKVHGFSRRSWKILQPCK